MSVQAMAWVLDEETTTYGTARLVLLSIANHADKYGRNAWPSVATIAREVNRDERTVQRALQALVANGLLTIDVQAGGGRDVPARKRPNRYTLPGMTAEGDGEPADDSGVTTVSPQGGPSGVTATTPGVTKTPVWGDKGVTQTVLNHPNQSADRPGSPSAPAAGFSAKRPPVAYEAEPMPAAEVMKDAAARARAIRDDLAAQTPHPAPRKDIDD